MMTVKKFRYEIRQIEAWAEPCEDDSESVSWTWNTSYLLSTFSSKADNLERIFRYQLHKLGISLVTGKTKIVWGGSIYEIIDKKTGEPLFAMIPLDY